MAKQLTLTARDIDAISRISHAEARSLGPDGIAGVVGTILNRAAAGGYGNGIEGVINKPSQFSPINSVGHWSRLPEASADTKSIVQQVVAQMRDGASNPVGNSTHFYNPSIASPKWGPQMEVQAQFGSGRNQHIHGTLPGSSDPKPPAYSVAITDRPSIAQVLGVGERPVPPRDIPNVGGVLQEGSRGADVKALQTQLNGQGYGLKVDGIFGPRTDGALMHAQAAAGLRPDGVYGPQTQAAFGSGRQQPLEPGSAPSTPAYAMPGNNTMGMPAIASRAAGTPAPSMAQAMIPGAVGGAIPTAGAFTPINPSGARGVPADYLGTKPEGGPGASMRDYAQAGGGT
jgi:hypothetical protein